MVFLKRLINKFVISGEKLSKQIITRKASDNVYFHKDFHIALNYGIDYLHKKFGKESVKEYLSQFADAYYSSLKKELKEKGLIAIKEHYEEIYKIENAIFNMNFSHDELIISLTASPAVMHIKSTGHHVSKLFSETILTVNKTLCRNTSYDVEMKDYNEENGGYNLRFFKRGK